MNNYPDVQLLINGKWQAAAEGETIPVINPATEATIGHVAKATRADLDAALSAAASGFEVWRKTSAFERYQCMRRAANLLRDRADHVAMLMSMEQGKPLVEAKLETLASADIIDWFAEEGRRTYGRIVPARMANVAQMVFREPVGPVAAFTPWNFPINQVVRKLSAATATGCSIIIKGPEDTPASPAELVRAFVDAGIPAGVVNLVYGVPAEISQYLIAHPVIRKITFTGSTEVGKQLASLAGLHMKRVTMELGGHAPAIVFNDADVDAAVKTLVANKFRNCGQVCVSPTRFIVQAGVYDSFVEKFSAAAEKLVVGEGIAANTQMGPVVNKRRLDAMERMVGDAKDRGAKVHVGGGRLGEKGYFFKPTVMTDLPLDSQVMTQEPFGPLALISRFETFGQAVSEANRLPYGLASYAWTQSAKTAADIANAIEVGMLSINHHGIGLPEVPFGGVKDSGYGSEGGMEGLEGYLLTKFVTQAAI